MIVISKIGLLVAVIAGTILAFVLMDFKGHKTAWNNRHQ